MLKNVPLKTCSKMFHVSKQNVTLTIQTLSELVFYYWLWISFLGNLFYLENLYFTFSGTGLVAIQVSFCKVLGENRKKLLPKIFLSYQTRTSLINVFIIFSFVEL